MMAVTGEQRSFHSNATRQESSLANSQSTDGATLEEILERASDLIVNHDDSQGGLHFSISGAIKSADLEDLLKSDGEISQQQQSYPPRRHSHRNTFASNRSRRQDWDCSWDTLPESDCHTSTTNVVLEFSRVGPRRPHHNDHQHHHHQFQQSRRNSLMSVSVGSISVAIPTTDAKLEDLERHKILGEGFFGQVHLVSEKLPNDTHRSFAMKIQSKAELVMEKRVEMAIREKEIMRDLRHPFLVGLIKTFQDHHFIYTLLPMLAGGELFSLLYDREDDAHDESLNGLPETQSRFYALCLSDALAYMHKRKIVYRDLKPENVIIDSQGYPVIVDFGLANKLKPASSSSSCSSSPSTACKDGSSAQEEKVEKTFTMCGTAKYCAPEVILGCGHDCAADNWSLGILIYEMVSADHPFYYDGIDQMSLFDSITNEDVDFEDPKNVSHEAIDLIRKLLVKNPTNRLGGSVAGGSRARDIRRHAWFNGLDLEALRKRQASNVPWLPTVQDPLDTRHFPDWSHLQDKTSAIDSNNNRQGNHPVVSQKDQARFEGF